MQECQYFVLVQEYADGGDLWSVITANSGRLSERLTVSLVLQPFLMALYYLHTQVCCFQGLLTVHCGSY